MNKTIKESTRRLNFKVNFFMATGKQPTREDYDKYYMTKEEYERENPDENIIDDLKTYTHEQK